MADLFMKQAKQYVGARPTYPPELFKFIASKTPCHDIVWDVGTGSGQAAQSFSIDLVPRVPLADKIHSQLACLYKNVVGTDTSIKQLELAPKLPNVRYERSTPPVLSWNELEQIVSTQSNLDLVTIAQALHWFDRRSFYDQVKWVLKKPHGVIAAWCYTEPRVNEAVDAVFEPFYAATDPFWAPELKLVDDRFSTIDFPFEPVEGTDHTGPFEFVAERLMNLEEYFTYIKSWSAYQTAQEKGVELLRDEVIESFKRAWNEDGQEQKVAGFPVFLRLGKVGNL